jgi:hypothetical protein
MVHEPINERQSFVDPRPGRVVFSGGDPGYSHGYRNAIRASFVPRPVSFTTALLGRVGHAEILA